MPNCQFKNCDSKAQYLLSNYGVFSCSKHLDQTINKMKKDCVANINLIVFPEDHMLDDTGAFYRSKGIDYNLLKEKIKNQRGDVGILDV